MTTVSNQFVSVFISQNEEAFIISDGGWINKKYYNEENTTKAEDEIILRVEDQLREHFGVKKAIHKDGTVYNFKSTKNEEMISLIVVELSNFIASISNNHSISYLEEKTATERKLFNNEVNGFLKQCFGNDVEINDNLKEHKEELSNIKFNAIVRRPTRTFLIMYVTGYNYRNFIGSASEAIVNFQISKKHTSDALFSRTAIINTHANGFQPYKVNEYLAELKNETNNGLVEFYENKNTLFKIIPQKIA
jgi:hypothetical protein